MSPFTCLVMCAVAVSLSSVFAAEDKLGSARDLEGIVSECAKQNEVTPADLQNVVMNKGDVSIIPSCFWGCAFSKAGFLNDQGQYDLDSGLASLKRFIRNPQTLDMFEKIAKECNSVKDKSVSDGKAGCEMGTLTAACFLEQLPLTRH